MCVHNNLGIFFVSFLGSIVVKQNNMAYFEIDHACKKGYWENSQWQRTRPLFNPSSRVRTEDSEKEKMKQEQDNVEIKTYQKINNLCAFFFSFFCVIK